MTPLDEDAFKKWLHACLDAEAVHVDALVLHAHEALGLIDIVDAKSDEQVYIRLFSQKKFENLTLVKRSQIKKAAILFHHYVKSRPG